MTNNPPQPIDEAPGLRQSLIDMGYDLTYQEILDTVLPWHNLLCAQAVTAALKRVGDTLPEKMQYDSPAMLKNGWVDAEYQAHNAVVRAAHQAIQNQMPKGKEAE